MAHERRFRFAAQAMTAGSAKDWAALARQVEDMGFSALTMPDHFTTQLAPVPALMAAADATTTLRLGTMVFGNDYRHPRLLAQECATLDLLSDGRLEVGLGAGWMKSDYDATGLRYDEPKVRVDRFEESIAALKGLWSGQPYSSNGAHYTFTDDVLHPAPVQKPHPPLVIGGGGKRVLSIAAREADIVGINPNLRGGTGGPEVSPDLTPAATTRKLGWVKEAAGDRYADLEITMLCGFAMETDDVAPVANGMANMFGVTPEEALHVPVMLIGTIDAMCDELRRRREEWDVSYIVFEAGTWERMGEVVSRLAGT
ncbi:MAG TPA: TIGR03621 family F420-dependent LLM class oxidoreductase [Mycobacteriales bacterium]|nr:TIGR03621 family F420-dependent LLM class oxidoreductase [Mycobacteriales bacterium]